MNSDILSQEEIDALLKGSDDSTTTSYTANILEDEEKDLLGEIGNICMGSASTTLSIIVNQSVNITTPKVKLTTLEELKENFIIPNVAIEVNFISGISGANLLVLKISDAAIIADLMMGGNGNVQNTDLSEIQISAVSEAMNQMIGTSATSMSTMFKKEVNISPPNAFLWDTKTQRLSENINEDDTIVGISFKLTIGTLIDSEIMQLLPISTAKDIISSMTSNMTSSSKEPIVEKKNNRGTKNTQDQTPKKAKEDYYDEEYYIEQNNEISTRPGIVGQDVLGLDDIEVHKAQFMPIQKQNIKAMPRNIDLILDVPLDVSVILGKTRKTIKEVLDLNNGSLIELDNLVEEPVQILVNGKMVAEGEVVVVNENFAVRITNIISDVDRIKKLQG